MLKGVKEDYTVDIKKLEQLIDCNTIMIVGSYCNFPYGTRDNIFELSNLAIKKNICLHVDGCLGGLVAAFHPYKTYKFDFILKGVTSLSVDTHKYGFAPKGTSVILYRNREMRNYQYSHVMNWTGGMYITPTIAGSRSGGLIACTWATLVANGTNGYKESIGDIVKGTYTIYKSLKHIKEIEILGEPDLCVISFKINEEYMPKNKLWNLIDELNKKGWVLNILSNPDAIHFCITKDNCHNAFTFINNVIEAVKKVKNTECEISEKTAIYGTASSLPDKDMLADVAIGFVDGLLDLV